MSQGGKRTVGIFITDGVEVLDFAGPFEVFSTALSTDDGSPRALFDVVTIATEERVITCTGGLLVQPHAALAQHPPLDVLVIPGGVGIRTLSDSRVLEWVRRLDRQTLLTASVCTGAFLLGACGLLDGRRVTTHWRYIEMLRHQFPAAVVLADARVVDEGHLVTAAGISAGIDMSLHLVARLCGEPVAVRTARAMEYEWRPAPG
jgi:transcriptional regulator GlxA family with amidase domain